MKSLRRPCKPLSPSNPDPKSGTSAARSELSTASLPLGVYSGFGQNTISKLREQIQGPRILEYGHKYRDTGHILCEV